MIKWFKKWFIGQVKSINYSVSTTKRIDKNNRIDLIITKSITHYPTIFDKIFFNVNLTEYVIRYVLVDSVELTDLSQIIKVIDLHTYIKEQFNITNHFDYEIVFKEYNIMTCILTHYEKVTFIKTESINISLTDEIIERFFDIDKIKSYVDNEPLSFINWNEF